jgi:hypothetical protein
MFIPGVMAIVKSPGGARRLSCVAEDIDSMGRICNALGIVSSYTIRSEHSLISKFGCANRG